MGVGTFFRLLGDAIPLGEESTISLAVDYLIDDPQVPFGRISKTKIARKLKHHVALISDSRRRELTKRLLYLLAHEITPTETLHVCRIVRQFLSPEFIPTILSLPIWNKHVDRRCNLLLPNFDEHCLESETRGLREKSQHELRNDWTATDAIHVGRIIFDSIPTKKRGLWAEELKNLVEGRVCRLPNLKTSLVERMKLTIDHEVLSWLALQPPNLDMTWGLSDIYHENTYSGMNHKIPSRTEILGYRVLGCLLEIRFHSVLRSQEVPNHRGWSVAPLLKAVVDETGDHQLESDIWQALAQYV